MLLSGRSNPHLRLTAAILVAVFAALAGSIDTEGPARGRRADLGTLVGGLRLVSVPSNGAHGLDRSALRAPSVQAGHAAELPAAGALGRAIARTRLDASRPTGAALLLNAALPPPVA
jgi:hypothetical protein